ncbi:hypothetical protein KY290_007404 [Solanum tuberosum]|uniref:Uncharacterized protein n=1 Tax=Solanum tuberosum TaxID=4113 RepID=A0ABQ7W7G3_SOLTU|nr:hypothetical protein KY290_007404 [Solanum tuberosum]
MENFHSSRRLLREAATMAPPPMAAGISHVTIDDLQIGKNVNTFDANVIMVFYPSFNRLILKPYKSFINQ